MVADAEGFQVAVPVELVVVVEGDGRKLRLGFWGEHGHPVPAEVGAGHGHNMRGGVLQKVVDEGTQVGFFQVRAHVVELVNGHQHVVEVGGGELLVGVTQRGVRAHQHRIGAVFQEADEGLNLAGVRARRAQVISRVHRPIREEPVRSKVRTGEGLADRTLGYRHNHLTHTLVEQLIQSNKHERAALTRSRWGLNQQVLRVTMLVHSLLHLTHAQLVRIHTTTRLGIANVHGINHGAISSSRRSKTTHLSVAGRGNNFVKINYLLHISIKCFYLNSTFLGMIKLSENTIISFAFITR